MLSRNYISGRGYEDMFGRFNQQVKTEDYKTANQMLFGFERWQGRVTTKKQAKVILKEAKQRKLLYYRKERYWSTTKTGKKFKREVYRDLYTGRFMKSPES